MNNPVTLFTGQWNDLDLTEVADLAAGWGYDGLEVDCSGHHLDLERALADRDYLDGFRRTLRDRGLRLWALSNHVAGHAVANGSFDFRHEELMLPRLWGDGDAEGIRARSAEELKRAAQVAGMLGVHRVVGFGGSSIWPYVVAFPSASESVIEAGYEDFARRWNPVLDVFDTEGVVFALEVHPGEIAYDSWTSRRALEALDRRSAFGFNWDPSHMMWQGIDPALFIEDFADRIYHVDCKDTVLRSDGRTGILSSHLPWGDERRAWDFVTAGRGTVPWTRCFAALAAIGYDGPVSIEWEDEQLGRLAGAKQALDFVRDSLFAA